MTRPPFTIESGRRYRRCKWAVMILAGLVPPLFILILFRDFWEHDKSIGVCFVLFTMYYLGLLIGAFVEPMRTSIRRKLLLAEWPKELYR